MSQLATDLRYALRLLRKSPLFTTTAVLVLALGIGAGTAIFTVVDHILFRPLDLPDSGRLVTLCETHESMRGWCGASPINTTSWAEQSQTLSAIGVGRGRTFALQDDEGSRFVAGAMATPGFFRALNVAPALGRYIRDDDLLPAGDARVVVVSHEFWQGELGGDPDVLGRRITLTEEPYLVVGVLPEGLRVPRLDWVRLWTPINFPATYEENRHWRGFTALGRLAPGATVPQAEAELTRIQRSLAEIYPEALEGWGARVQTTHDYLVADSRPTLLVFAAAVGVVLLMVVVNLASMLLARATTRERELAVRRALGAGGGRLVRQLLTESALIAALGGISGVIVAYFATRAFLLLAPPGIPRMDEIALDGRILGFALGVTALTALLVGLAPAVRARGSGLIQALRDGRSLTASRTAARLRRSLVVGEVALAVVLLVGAALLMRSFTTLLDWEPGFQTEQLLTFSLFMATGEWENRQQLVDFYRQLDERLEALPDVESAATASAGPLFGGGDGRTPFLVEGRPDQTVEDAPTAQYYDVGPDYFETMGIPLRAGRFFEESDDAGAPNVAIINESMARRHWPDSDPLGSRVTLPRWQWQAEIVGVVGDVQPFNPEEAPEAEIYMANRQATRPATFVVLRTRGEPLALTRAVTEVVEGLNPALSPSRIASMSQSMGRELVRPRFNMLLVGIFAFVALVLGAAGIYGVVAYAVALRTHEIGVRMALGAERVDIVRWVMSEGNRLVGVGLILGLAGALAFSRLLAGLLYGVEPTDPVAIAAAIVVLASVAAVAALVPARRASRIDPVRALRQE